jgi:hypothetical protein
MSATSSSFRPASRTAGRRIGDHVDYLSIPSVAARADGRLRATRRSRPN